MKSRERYEILYSIARELASSLAPDEVLNTIVESVTRAVNAKGCSLMLLTPDKKQLTHTVSYGLSRQYLSKGPVMSNIIIKEVLNGKSVTVLNAPIDPRVQYKAQAKKEGIASMFSVPLKPNGEVIGIMRVYTSEPRRFSTQDVGFLGYLANLGAIALEKAKLHEALNRDLELRCAEVAKLEEEKNRFLRFLSIAAHDLKAPLSAIQGFMWVMLKGFPGPLTDKQKHMLERSAHRIDELLNLISDLLDIPRIETGQIVPEIKVISLYTVIRPPVRDLREQAKEKGLKFKLELPAGLPKVYGSVPRLQQVINNLVNNAIKYTPEGGITLRVSPVDCNVQIEVMDTGIGIPQQDLPKMFEDFYRASNNPAEVKGTGLGLSISRRIVEAHGGKIWVESPCPQTGNGTRFTFTLPTRHETERRQR
ncbi:MAG: GAF domain-containing sensor histidine kinase [Dehalococcoidia bacterium]|nr:GAF domain-containing sensor histidine kinase [Dehalococcoidia bacterium]